jgi:hypothetical protein
MDQSKLIAALATTMPDFEKRFGADTVASIRNFE